MTKEHKLTKGPLAGMTVTSAPQDRVTRLAPYVDRVLAALCYPEAYVTDESSVGDFYTYDGDNPTLAAEQAASLRGVATQLGIALRFEDCIADVAERLQGGH